METALLATKLHIPPLRQRVVLRPRLSATLSETLARRLTLVSAPAGYGKTTLVSSWLREVGVQAAWLSLEEADNDPIRFLRYLLAALHEVLPELPVDLPSALAAPSTSPDALINLLADGMAGHPSPFVLVLDDFHCVGAQPILEMLAYLLDHMPPQMHLVILTRHDPPLPLPRLRVRDHLVEIRANELCFTPSEIGEFLSETAGLGLSPADVATISERTEGWVAALQLASITLRSRLPTVGSDRLSGPVSAFTGSHHYIVDYLTEEVLKTLPERVQLFLIETSILDQLCGPLCDAVLDGSKGEPAGGQSVLEALQRDNLFVVPLDDERRWYRYHNLFRDVLSRMLEQSCQGMPSELHRRASSWYEENGLLVDAARHSLRAGDIERSAQLVERHGCPLLMRGEFSTLLTLIDAVEPHSQTRPWLAVYKAWALTLAGHLDRAEQIVETVERKIASATPHPEGDELLGCITSARAYRASIMGDAHLAEETAQKALSYLPEGGPLSCSLRGITTSILGDASRMNGNIGVARSAYGKAILIGQQGGNRELQIIANCNLGEILAEQGQLHEAARLFAETAEMALGPQAQLSPLAPPAHAGLSGILYEWNHLDGAAESARRCLDASLRWGNREFQAVAQLLLARVEQAQHHSDSTREAMRAVERLAVEGRASPGRSVWLLANLVRLWISQGDLEKAAHSLERSGITLGSRADAFEIPFVQEPAYVALLRLLLARGDWDAALTLSERLLHKTEEEHRTGLTIELLILRALLYHRVDDTDGARETLGEALLLAEPEGYVRLFLDEGEPMSRLLYHARAHHVGQEYAAELLSAIRSATAAPDTPPQPLVEPLSSRELEVLRLIYSGCSNQEIASRLVISLLTTKRHISNIYGKLGASSRTQAISLGRELGLFD